MSRRGTRPLSTISCEPIDAEAPLRWQACREDAQKKRKNPNGASADEAKTYTHPDATVLLSVAATTVLERADRERGR